MNPTVFTRQTGNRLFDATRKITAFALAFLFFFSGNLLGQNAIATENALPGSPRADWDISGSGNPDIQGFATDISTNTGGTVHFKVNVNDASSFNVKIYRLGYYNGDGARMIADLGTFAGITQPSPVTDLATGLVDCGNWTENASWTSTGAVSGVYIAKLTKLSGGASSHIIFIIRNDASNSALLFKTSDATWQAYNVYGGNSLYVGTTTYPSGHAVKVSYNRPFFSRDGGGGGGPGEDWIFNAEYPMIRFLERNGYDVSYTTDVDMDRDATPITPSVHKAILSVGHDEYWSLNERNKVENARAAGVNLAFFSGNEVYWKTRWESSIDGSNTDHRTLVCYKEGTEGENVCGSKCDPLGTTWTGLWRSGCTAGLDACSPENALTGQISWAQTHMAMSVPSTFKDYRFWRNTDVATLTSGQTRTLSDSTIGFEFDWNQNNYQSTYPLGRVPLSMTDVGGKTHEMSLYRSSSGALVFGAGTIQYSWGLDSTHDIGSPVPDVRLQQATINLFAEMGAQPTTLMPGLVAATATGDVTPPSSVISTPAQGDNISTSSYIHITGTSTESGGGIVAGVEISTDGGATWNLATGTTSWSYDWLPTTSGTFTIKVRAFDDMGNLEAAGTAPSSTAITVNVTVTTPTCPCYLFPGTATPAALNNDATPIEVGMKFKSTVNGYITGIRFYKPGTAGVYTVNLWDTQTQQRITYANVSQSLGTGWVTVELPTPVAITAGHAYIATYYSSSGEYAETDNFFTSEYVNGYLIGLKDTTGNENGVYNVGSSLTPENNYQSYPSLFYQASNYWVDPEFNTSVPPDTIPPTVSHVTPIANSTGNLLTASVNAIFSEPVDSATVTTSSFILKDASNNQVSATVSYNSTSRTATLFPSAPLQYGVTYTATVKGGAVYDAVRDLAGNHMAADYSWSFTTVAVPPPPPTVGPGGPILVVSSTSNPFSQYPAEILRAEGLNEFSLRDISQVNADTLNRYDVVILGEIPLSASNVTDLTAWVNAGGTLIALKPDAQLNSLLGISYAGTTQSDRYLKIDTTVGLPGHGIVGETIQYHSTANNYTLNGATRLATLYTNATDSTTFPAVTTINVGSNGGKAIAFAYDLAKSIVYTRQGNPAWSGQKRDGEPTPIRSDDMFFGNASFDPQPDWIDFTKVQIPQADEQMRLLTNLITHGNLHKKPLPRFWFLPRKLKAAIVMTGDDHANAGTIGRFNLFLSYGNNTAADVQNWNAIRGTSYIYPNTPITDSAAAYYESQGFEIALHLTTNCEPYTYSSLKDNFTTQLPIFAANFPSVPAPATNRTHCIAWSDWASKPVVEVANGIRLNTDYYYWPGTWVQNRAGLFTGSGMPMRFADSLGNMIDDYQVTTQMPDESQLSIGSFTQTLLDNATGPKGYYGVFCTNMHTDDSSAGSTSTLGSEAIISAAQAKQIPVISARQMLTWLDGRNNSSFSNMSWTGNVLNFDINVASGAYKLQAMVPIDAGNGALTGITLNGTPVSYTHEVIKGVDYAFFDASNGTVAATYNIDNTPPVISNFKAVPNIDGTLTLSWNTDEAATTVVNYGTSAAALNQNNSNNNLVTSHSVTLSGLSVATTYYLRINSADIFGNTAYSPDTSVAPMSILMPNSLCFLDTDTTNFKQGTTGDSTYISSIQDGEVMLKPKVAEEFSSLPATTEWNSFPWTGGTSTDSAGMLVVNGARYNSEMAAGIVGPGSSIEFVAKFDTAAGQHIGFGAGTDATGSGGIYYGGDAWAMFSTGSTNNQVLKARTFTGSGGFLDFDIAGNYVGSTHRYRIDWKTNSIDYYIDGVLVHTENAIITGTMRAAVSDYYSTLPSLYVDWIHVLPYPASGTYLSRIYDGGVMKNWETAMWTDTIPASTTMTVLYRRGNTATPDATWTSFDTIPSSGTTLNKNSRYIQYRVDMTTSNPAVTPELHSIGISCVTATNEVPQITTQPVNTAVCEGDTAVFISGAIGNPIPTVQWQVSTNGGSSWADTTGAVSDTLKVAARASDSAYQYRAVWTNAAGNDTTTAAILTVHAKPVALISAVDTAVCEGNAVVIKLDSASGPGPYTLVVGGQTYTGVQVGDHFATLHPLEKSIWDTSGTPAETNHNAGSATELGVKFRSSVAGYIKGIRFYKGATNTGTHTGTLWSSSGGQLATATFTSESDSGWQAVRFSTPVFIQANTTYVASYSSPNGIYALTSGGFASSSVVNGPLTALQSGTDGANGVLLAGTGFPTAGTSDNYWVDVLFEPAQTSAQSVNIKLTSVSNANGCTNSGDSLTSATVTVNALPDGTIAAANATTCNSSNISLVFTATNGVGPYTLVINDSTYTNITSGTPFDSRVVAKAQLGTKTIWDSTTVGGSPASPDPGSIELGVKFRTTVAGKIKGIRFYKLAGNTGLHTGTLWSSTGTQLATATFGTETGSGWQQVNFSAPVDILPGQTYVASYHAPNGNYAYTAGTFTSSGVTDASGVITALQNGVDGNNGVYLYSAGTAFPTDTSGAHPNYWVDVVFEPTNGVANFSLSSITSATGCVRTGSPISSTSVEIRQVDATAVITNATCHGSATGSLAVTGINGTAPYTYSIDTGATFQSSGTFANLLAGDYLIRIKDSTGCSKDTVLTVGEPSLIDATISISNNSCYGDSTGSFTVTASGGAGSYNYSIDTGATYQTSGTFNNLKAGNYLVRIKDANNCTRDTVVAVTQPAQVMGTLSTVNSCPGNPITLVYNASAGTGPFSLVINGVTYNNIADGGTISTGVTASGGNETIFDTTSVGAPSGDNGSIEVGVKFRSNVAGEITGIRFYKVSTNVTTHIGNLWKSDGTLLATVTFTGETASGWQQANFSTPVTITPGVTYIASYFTDIGSYAYQANTFTNSGVTNPTGTLTALQNGVDGNNGVYKYSPSSTFPTDTSASHPNYYVDVVFHNTSGMARYALTSITSASGCTTTGSPISTVLVGSVPVSGTIDTTALDCLESSNGNITITGSGGSGSYTYSINNGSTFQDSGIFHNLTAGTYQIKIKDANGCTKDTSATIGVAIATWTGATSSDWHTASNWSTGVVPNASTHVLIPAGTPNSCIISTADAEAASVQVQTGAIFNAINNHVLTIHGKCSTLPPL